MWRGGKRFECSKAAFSGEKETVLRAAEEERAREVAESAESAEADREG